MKALATYELTIKRNANSWNRSEFSENRATPSAHEDICPIVKSLRFASKLRILIAAARIQLIV